MFNRPIAIIVGAGAGFEYRMPLGSKLAADIAADVRFRFEPFQSRPISGDAELFESLRRKFRNDQTALNEYSLAGNALASAISSAVSIDDALYQLGENPAALILGKLAIIRSIVKAENQSTIRLSRETGRLEEAAGREGWIEPLFSMAIANLRQSEIHTAFDNVTFVNFNYDRCIEHYIYWSFQRLGLNEAESARIVASLKMIRPYGGLGTSLPAVHGHLAFGYHSHADFFELINRIRTYTESAVHDSNILEDALHRAELILILGFGFHAQNLNLLRLDQPREARVIATVKNVHRANLVDITDALIRTLRIAPEQIELFDMTTPELLQNLRLKILRRTSAD